MTQALMVEHFPSGDPLAIVVAGPSGRSWRCLEPDQEQDLARWLRAHLARPPLLRRRELSADGRTRVLGVAIAPESPAYLQALADRLTFHAGRQDVRVRPVETGLRSSELSPL
jgi:hypothetical protein